MMVKNLGIAWVLALASTSAFAQTAGIALNNDLGASLLTSSVVDQTLAQEKIVAKAAPKPSAPTSTQPSVKAPTNDLARKALLEHQRETLLKQKQGAERVCDQTMVGLSIGSGSAFYEASGGCLRISEFEAQIKRTDEELVVVNRRIFVSDSTAKVKSAAQTSKVAKGTRASQDGVTVVHASR